MNPPVCACGCGGEIIPKPFHKTYGTPKFILGHHHRVNHPFKGKRLSKEHRKNIGIGLMGRICSEKTKRKISKSERGKVVSPITRELLRMAQTGKKHKKESIERLRALNTLDKHPQWLGGISFLPYDKQFNQTFKNKIRERDNYCCQLCGAKKKHYLYVHHIDYCKMNTDEKWSISLCNSCHSKTNFGRDMWSSILLGLMSIEYNYTY